MLSTIVIASISFLLGISALLMGWKSIWNRMQSGSLERAKLRAEFVKTMLQAAAAIAIIPSIVLSLADYRNQLEKDRRDSAQKSEAQHSDQFRSAITLLQEPAAGSTEAGIVILGIVTRFDPNQYTCPSLRVLRSKLIELQTQSNNLMDWSRDANSLRYRMLFEAYRETYRNAPDDTFCSDQMNGSTDPPTALPNRSTMDLTFIRVRGFAPPRTTGLKGSYRGAVLLNADFSGFDLSGSYFDGADLSESSFVGATLTNASFRGATLRNVSLVGATLINANLDGATMIGARMSGSNLNCTNLRGADLSDATVSVDDIAWAKVYDETVMPATLCEQSNGHCIARFSEYRKVNGLRRSSSVATGKQTVQSNHIEESQCDY